MKFINLQKKKDSKLKLKMMINKTIHIITSIVILILLVIIIYFKRENVNLQNEIDKTLKVQIDSLKTAINNTTKIYDSINDKKESELVSYAIRLYEREQLNKTLKNRNRALNNIIKKLKNAQNNPYRYRTNDTAINVLARYHYGPTKTDTINKSSIKKD